MFGRGLVDSTTAADNRQPLTAAAAEPQQQRDEEHVGSSSRDEEKEAAADASAPPPPASTRMSGWGTGTTAGLGEQRAQRRAAADLTDDDDDDGIPVIPDLEEEEEEDMTRQVAAPPTDYALHLSTQKELQAAAAEPDGNKNESSSRLRPLDPHPEPGIDLSVLFELLLTPEELEVKVYSFRDLPTTRQDPNEVWDHGLLLQQLAAEMAAEEGDTPQQRTDKLRGAKASS
ncbi:hypothetical protein FOZ63_018777 [Perkinsus olseni]|uniref:Intraflagellar transport protein 43 n=1 Tax=Perkinsus olseni TaxID=32597 RepID=A0A7J6THY2_PEROL|nr:hypothetical protein FOZ62_004228 [Perkinsus olseni]KAF4744803.1 hypothetical protein FOZ63_018777 [Perkinsus olseni]